MIRRTCSNRLLPTLPCKQFVDDVEFWFPPGKGSIVEYRSASRLGNFDFDVNRKRIKVKLHHSCTFSTAFSIVMLDRVILLETSTTKVQFICRNKLLLMVEYVYN